jgi:hypothetical protein
MQSNVYAQWRKHGQMICSILSKKSGLRCRNVIEDQNVDDAGIPAGQFDERCEKPISEGWLIDT